MKKAICSFIYHKLLGWKSVVNVEDFDKQIICAAPHTSNWDFIIGKLFYASIGRETGLYLNGAILGMKKRQIDRKIDEIIDFSGIEKHIDTPAKRYSSGMYVRLAFAVAAHLDNEILIADEVLAVGDASFQKKALGKMNDVSASQGRTVLFVSHQMNFISQLCPSCVILDRGRVGFQGPTSEAIPRYLQLGAGVAAQLDYDNDPRKPIMITGFRIETAQGESSTQFTIHDSIFATVRYTVNEPVRFAYVSLHILGPEEQNLVDNCDVDTDPTLYEKREPGEYIARIAFPTHLLNAGRFYTEIWVGIPSARTTFFKTDKIGIDIVDTGSEATPFNKTRPSLLLPTIKWETRRTGEY